MADCQVKITKVTLGTANAPNDKEPHVKLTVDYSVTPGDDCDVIEVKMTSTLTYITEPPSMKKKVVNKSYEFKFDVDASKTSDDFVANVNKKAFCAAYDGLKKNKNLVAISLVTTIEATCLCKGRKESVIKKGADTFTIPQSELDAFCT